MNINYSTGDNLLNGGDGNDYFNAAYYNVVGRNTLNGGNGDDLFYVSAPESTPSGLVTQTVDGGTGNDTLSVDDKYANGAITLTYNATTNIGSITAGTNQVSFKNIERLEITGTAYDDYLVGTNGDDFFSGGGGNNTIIGGAGNDSLSTYDSGGNNLLFGGDGNDSLNASAYYIGTRSGNNTLSGGAGDDYLSASFSTGNNLFNGGDGKDYLSISGSVDDYGYYATSGNNTLNGGAGNDTLLADDSTGNNLLSGGDGNDTLSASGAFGNNTFYGGNGNDYLTGGKGNDTLYGGTGTDTFAFNSYKEGVDRLYDFNATNELIQVSAAGFGGGLSIGSLKTSQFTLGTSATTSNQRFIYDNITGGLYFDLDGNASRFAQVKFAQLSVGVSLTKNNFVVV